MSTRSHRRTLGRAAAVPAAIAVLLAAGCGGGFGGGGRASAGGGASSGGGSTSAGGTSSGSGGGRSSSGGGASSGGGGSASGGGSSAVSDAPVTITWQTNGVAPTSPLMKPLENEIATYEKSHPNVHVQWVQTNLAGNDQEAYLTTNAAGGKVPDVTTENWATVLAGAIPNGILTNLMPFLQRPNPYVKGNKKWLDTWQSTVLPNMEISKSKVELIVGSNVETGIFYNKKLFAEAGITGTPSNWAQWVADMAKLKAKGITPFIFGTGGNCNPSWYERNFESQLLNKSFQKFDPDRSTLQTSSLDVAVGI